MHLFYHCFGITPEGRQLMLLLKAVTHTSLLSGEACGKKSGHSAIKQRLSRSSVALHSAENPSRLKMLHWHRWETLVEAKLLSSTKKSQ